jgi:cytochrome c
MCAMAIYLKSLGQGNPPTPEVSGIPAPESSLLMNFGETVYATHCASCHAADGRGMPPDYPPLAGNPSIQMESIAAAAMVVSLSTPLLSLLRRPCCSRQPAAAGIGALR